MLPEHQRATRIPSPPSIVAWLLTAVCLGPGCGSTDPAERSDGPSKGSLEDRRRAAIDTVTGYLSSLRQPANNAGIDAWNTTELLDKTFGNKWDELSSSDKESLERVCRNTLSRILEHPRIAAGLVDRTIVPVDSDVQDEDTMWVDVELVAAQGDEASGSFELLAWVRWNGDRWSLVDFGPSDRLWSRQLAEAWEESGAAPQEFLSRLAERPDEFLEQAWFAGRAIDVSPPDELP